MAKKVQQVKEEVKEPTSQIKLSAKASVKGVFVTPRKARLVADLVRGHKVSDALDILRNTNKALSPILYKLIHSAAANATNNFKMKEDKLVITSLQVGDGYRFKKLFPRGRGRTDSLTKRTCNIYVIVGEGE